MGPKLRSRLTWLEPPTTSWPIPTSIRPRCPTKADRPAQEMEPLAGQADLPAAAAIYNDSLPAWEQHHPGPVA